MIPKAVIATPCSYVLSPGAVITGGFRLACTENWPEAVLALPPASLATLAATFTVTVPVADGVTVIE